MAYRIRKGAATPSGWLIIINPEKELMLLFIRDPKSLMRMPNVITQLWHSNKDGIPTTLKNIRTMNPEGSIETWNELLNNGWELAEIDHQINNDVA